MRLSGIFRLCVCVGASCLAAGSVRAAAVTQTENLWQAVDGSWQGSWDDPHHWSLGAIGAKQKGRFDLKKGQDNVVTYPSGAYTNAGEVFARGWDTRWSFQLVGTNTTYTMGGSSDGTDIHSAAPFRVCQGNYPGYFDTGYTGPYSAAPIVMSNFLFKAVSADDGLNILFDGGLYDMPNCGVSFLVGDPANMPYDRLVEIRNATMNVSYFKICVTKALNQPGLSRVVLDNSTVNSSGRFIFPEASDGCESWYEKNTFEFLIDNGSKFTFSGMALPGYTKSGVLTNKLQVITVDHGSSFVQSGDPADFYAHQGHYVFNILNGSKARFGSRSIYFGNTGYGVTDVNISNAVHSILGTYYFGPRTSGADPSSDYYNTACANLNVYNGAVTNLSNGLMFTSAGLKLVDSLFYGRPIVMQATDAATARFHANGATMRFTDDNNKAYDLLCGFDEATVAARGLVVENHVASQGNVYPLSQDFSDAPGEKGVVTFAGTKNFTLNSTNTTVSTVAVAGVTATFADNARFASTLVVTNGGTLVNVPANGLKGLVVGDATGAGTLTVDFAKTIDVAGEITFANTFWASSSALAKDVTNVVFTADAASAATRLAWKNASIPATVPSACGLLKWTADVGGRVVFYALAREAQTRTETLATATSETRDGDISIAGIDTLDVQVAEGGSLTLTGTLGEGRFEKHGAGTVTLTNPNNCFIGGVGLYAGVLAVTSPGALGYAGNNALAELKGGALEFAFAEAGRIGTPTVVNATDATKPIVLNAKADVTMPAWTATAGSVLKRGPGRLSLEAAGSKTIIASYGSFGTADGTRGTSLRANEPLCFDAAGVYESGFHAGLTVLEGELRLAGTAAYTAQKSFAVGGPVAAEYLQSPTRPAGLVVDGATVDTMNSPGGLTIASAMKLGTSTPASMSGTYVAVTNGATLLAHNFFVLKNSDGTADDRLTVDITVADRSTLSSFSRFYPNESSSFKTLSRFFVRNGSKILANDLLEASGPFEMSFDASEFAKNAAGACQSVTIPYNSTSATNRLSFANGSVFRCGSFTCNNDKMATELTFDDSEWYPGAADYTFTPNRPKIRTSVRGRGLVLAPAAGVTHTWRYDLTGPGGFVKRGAGTAVLNVTNALYAGTTAVEAGTLDLEDSTWTRRAFGGTGGTLANGTLERCVVANTNLTYAASLQIVGRHKIDLCGAGVPGETVVVGRYEGAAPDVSSWRIANSGGDGLAATFVAADNVITATLRPSDGLMVIVK